MDKKTLATVAFAAILGACNSHTIDGPMKLGGKWVPVATLNQGRDTYMQYCMQCHGVNGDGLGPASQGMNPIPRNFKQGIFKFGSVTSGELPTDEDLKRTIRYGLKGTAMLPWDISDERLNAVVQYIKTFSPVWQEQASGNPQKTSPDPFGAAHAAEAIALGKQVYHGIAQCYQCHPSYEPLSEVNADTKALTGNGVTTIRDNVHLSTLLDSSYNTKVMPPDFTKIMIRTGGSIPDLYRTIGAGIGGTTMPAWKGNLAADEAEGEKRLWAVAYYVNSLHKLKFDSEARKKFFSELDAKRSR